MKKNTLTFVAILVIVMAPQFAHATALDLVTNACTQSDLAIDPISHRTSPDSTNYDTLFATQGRTVFDPKATDHLYTQSSIAKLDVSSAHVVNTLAQNFAKIHRTEIALQKDGKHPVLEEGRTYSADEYDARKAIADEVHDTKIEPLLKNLVKSYLSGIAREEEKKADSAGKTADQKRFYDLARQQRAVLMAWLQQVHPSVLKNFGSIPEVIDGQQLPFSYRDGYIVKIRFQRPGDKYYITVYPRMVANQILGEDNYFIESLARFKEYLFDLQRDANAMKTYQDTSLGPWYGSWYVWIGFKLRYGGGGYYKSSDDGLDHPTLENMEEQARRLTKAYVMVHEDYNQAVWIHNRVSQIPREDLLSIFELLRTLKAGDIPNCASTAQALTKELAKKIDGNSSSSAPALASQKEDIDKLGRDAVFYQDIYDSFSSVASELAAERATKK